MTEYEGEAYGEFCFIEPSGDFTCFTGEGDYANFNELNGESAFPFIGPLLLTFCSPIF